jgi:hypothetical protein
MAMTRSGRSVITIGPDTPPAWRMCVIRSFASSARTRAGSERSSSTCRTRAGSGAAGSSPTTSSSRASRRGMTALPRNPLAPVTRMRFAMFAPGECVMLVKTAAGGRGGIRTHEGPCEPWRFSRPLP